MIKKGWHHAVFLCAVTKKALSSLPLCVRAVFKRRHSSPHKLNTFAPRSAPLLDICFQGDLQAVADWSEDAERCAQWKVGFFSGPVTPAMMEEEGEMERNDAGRQ